MPRLVVKKPRYCRFATKYACVKINGKFYSLGKYRSPESKEKYARLLAEKWNAPDAGPPPESEQVTITELCIIYMRHARQHYTKNGQPTAEVGIAQVVLRRVREIYGSTLASEFGPLRFQQFRDTLIKENLARTTINHYCFHGRWKRNDSIQLAGATQTGLGTEARSF